ncbi:MAG: TatD family hydrolase [Thermodesulfobacteriota bacterium]|nr:TatD family hydrolase [Thermodesulfobacteriota bacterium]
MKEKDFFEGLIDTHTHLEEVDDMSGAIERAEEAGIAHIIAVGSNHESNKRILEISGKYGKTQIHAAFGLHPWGLDASEVDSTLCFIEENMKKAIAVGEVGLDFWSKEARKDSKRRDLQKEVFKRLLHLSKQYNKPVLIHARGAWEECFYLTRDAKISKAVFHWYSGPLEVLESILNSGYLISATPAAEYSEKHQRAIMKTPLERILIETDAPVEYQGKRSEPADLLRSLDAVSKLKGVQRETVADITTRNGLNFFDLCGYARLR